MPIADTRDFSGDEDVTQGLACDICVIGTGPAGSTIARELSTTSLRVTVLESGSFERQEHVDELNSIENVGRSRVLDQWRVRNRIVGGSSHTWTGRCAAFDEIDFERREWVSNSGWPFDLRQLTPYLERSAAYLGLGIGAGFSDDRFWQIIGQAAPKTKLDTTTLLPFFWQYTKDAANPYDYMRFGRHLVSNIGPNVTLVTNATVLRVNAAPSGAVVQSVYFVGVDGRRWTLPASKVVLCAGAIENARLLLCSDDVQPLGLGNEHDLVGRFLMDHPRGTTARFELKDAGLLLRRFGLFRGRGSISNRFQAGLRLSPDIQRREHLLNCSGWIHEEISEDDPWHAVKRFLRGTAQIRQDATLLLRNADLLARGLHSYLVVRNGLPRRIQALSLDCMCEQSPDPLSRLTLSRTRDRLDQRLPKLDWRVDPGEARAMRRLTDLVVQHFPKMGLPAPSPEPWVRDGGMFPDHFEDIAHPTGTTRLADDPRQGVVDATLQVHGIAGLYVAGSSVFPTTGHCNPTQMIVAMALRLADDLRSLNAASAVSASAKTEDVSTQQASGPLILVTGGSGRIGTHVLQRLTADGYRVRALTSKPITAREGENRSIEWWQHDFLTNLSFDSATAGCSGVVHLAAELRDTARMDRLNVEATQALAEAAERAGIRTFVYTSSAAVYGSLSRRPVTEDSPVLTSSRDVKSEYWAADWLRAYGRTKLAGEEALHKTARTIEYIVLRPTTVVDKPDLLALGGWGRVRKQLFAGRHAHHIYMPDVADAIVWLMSRALRRDRVVAGVATFVLSEDEVQVDTYKAFFDSAFAATGDSRFKVVGLPWQIDWLRALVQARSLPFRPTYGQMQFSNKKLRAEGWRPSHGMDEAVSRALKGIARRQ